MADAKKDTKAEDKTAKKKGGTPKRVSLGDCRLMETMDAGSFSVATLARMVKMMVLVGGAEHCVNGIWTSCLFASTY
jgi:hypothetical protein